jgi:thiol-disulfide isomerase/thioredoxin
MPRLVRFGSLFVLPAVVFTLMPAPRAIAATAPDGGPSAMAILKSAEAEAHAQHKNILLSFGASWCVNCRLFDQFVADPQIHPILSRAFVFASMDTGEFSNSKYADTPGGVAYENSIGGRNAGFPFLVMLDADGKPIVDSYRPAPGSAGGKDNIGYPVLPAEVDWFVEMLHRAAPQLIAQDLAVVHAWLTAHAAPLMH